MAKGQIISPEVSPVRSRGRAYFYWSNKWQRYIIAKWPSGNGGDTPKRAKSRADFSAVTKLIKYATGDDTAAAYALAKGIPFLPRDLLAKAAYGTLFQFRKQDGTIWKGVRVAQSEIETYLNSISSALGSVLVRTADGWVALLPGDPAQVLTLDANSLPTWSDAASGGGGTTLASMCPLTFDSGSAYGVGYCKLAPLVAPKSFTATKVCFYSRTAVPDAVVTPAIYAIASNAPAALLATGPSVAGVTEGINALPLDAPYTWLTQTPVAVGVTQQGNSVYYANYENACGYYFAETGTPPDPAPSASFTLTTRPAYWMVDE